MILPIWKAAFDLAGHLEHAVRRFPRYHKYTLGTKLRQTAQSPCRAERVWQKTLLRFPWLSTLFEAPENALRGLPLRPAWTATTVSGLAGQTRTLRQRNPDALLLVQVGNRWLLPVPRPWPLPRIPRQRSGGRVPAAQTRRSSTRAGRANRPFEDGLQAPRTGTDLATARRAFVFKRRPHRI